MKMYVYLTIAVCAAIVAVVTECGLLKKHSAEIHQSIVSALQKAYGGGAEKVSSRIDSLVAKGKLPTVQAEKLNEALQKGYDSLQSKLAELSVRESPRRTKGGIKQLPEAGIYPFRGFIFSRRRISRNSATVTIWIPR